MKKFSEKFRYHFEVLMVLIYKEWIVKYKGTVLGYIWSVAHPLVLSVVFYIAFKIALKISVEDYLLFLIPGLFAWQWFTNSVMVGVWSFVSNASIIKKTRFPKYLIQVAISFLDMFHFMLSIPIIITFLFIYHKNLFYLSWLYEIPIVLALQLLLSISVGLIFGTLNVFVRDVDRLASLFVTLLIYLTPVFYSLEMIPAKYRTFFYLNPMVHIVELWRGVFLDGKIKIFNLICGLFDVVFILLIAILVYKKLSDKFAEYL